MLTTTRHLRRFRQDKRGVSNVIVIVLSLVILVVITSNVILWSYEMNRLDWEKMQESIEISSITGVNSSRWVTTQSEYSVQIGSRTNGSYEYTTIIDELYESFQEEGQTAMRARINGSFIIDVATYPLENLKGIVIQLRYRANDSGERWYLRASNWTSGTYSDSGFNSTTGHLPMSGFDHYTVNLTDQWRSYIRTDGRINIQLVDEDADGDQTTIDIDFLAVRALVEGMQFSFKNRGASTCHIASVWVVNSTIHERYAVDLFVNTGELSNYTRIDIAVPTSPYFVKIVTERGNTAVYSAS